MAAGLKDKNEKSYLTNAMRWAAVSRRDKAADNRFVFAVKTTGVYCRASCPSRMPLRANVVFYQTPAEAERAGFRACKRCKPNAPSAHGELTAIVANVCKLIVDAKGPLPLSVLGKLAGMSPHHFHRVFKAATGLTPKAYAMAHRAERVRNELSRRGTVTSAIYNAGFNSNGRFYAESEKHLGMKPAAFKAGGDGVTIRFAVGECSFGPILIAASDLGVCSITLGDDPRELRKEHQNRFPKATLIEDDKGFEKHVAQVVAFVENPSLGLHLPLHVRGTAFQHRVWQALREIPSGSSRTYSEIAKKLGDPKSVRAVAGACAANTLAVAIPCHRVVRSDGSSSGYRWGLRRQAQLLQKESARN